MPKVSLAAYSLSVSPRGNPEDLQPVDSFDGKHSLLLFVHDYCSSLQQQSHHYEGLKSLVRQDALNLNEAAGLIYGTVFRGEYGQKRDLVDVDTGTVAYARKPHDAEMIPFYFLVELRSGTRRGIVLTQRLGHLGLRTDFLHGITSSFAKQFASFRVSVRNLVPQDLLRHFLQNGDIKTVKYTSFVVPQEVADFLGDQGYKERLDRAITILKPQSGQYFPVPKALQKFKNGGELTTIAELKEEGLEELSIEVKIGKSTKTIDFNNINNFRAYFDITDKVKTNDDGNPNVDQIHTAALELLGDLRAEVNLTHVSQDERMEHSDSAS